MPESPSLQSRARGALLGAAIGDALGAPYEGASPQALDPQQLIENPGPLRYTDDTHMLIGLAESLLERGGFDGDHMAWHFARRYNDEPWRGYGSGPPRLFRMMEEGIHWRDAAQRLYDGGSFGNGGAMRVAPAAIFAAGDPPKAAALAGDTARITHAHPRGIAGAVAQAVATAVVMQTDAGDTRLAENVLATARDHARDEEFTTRLEAAGRLLDPRRAHAAITTLGNGIAAHESVPAAIWAFLCHPNSFADAVSLAISLGGDADTIASMTGALAGAHLGEDAIPEPWREGVEDAAHLYSLADRLLSAQGG